MSIVSSDSDSKSESLGESKEEKDIVETQSTTEGNNTSLEYIPDTEDLHSQFEILETLYDERLSPAKVFKVKQITDG